MSEATQGIAVVGAVCVALVSFLVWLARDAAAARAAAEDADEGRAGDPSRPVPLLEVQLCQAPGPTGPPGDLFRIPTRSVAIPSRRRSVLLLLAVLEELEFRMGVGELGDSGMVLVVDDVPKLVAALEAARGARRAEFVEALLELERDDAERHGGPVATAARVEAALDAGELRSEPTSGLEAASLVGPLLEVARGAVAAGRSVQLLHRPCELVRGGESSG